METVYRLKAEDVVVRVGEGNDNVSTLPTTNSHRQLHHHHHHLQHSDPLIKIQIANHPLYPHLLSAYIQCQKVGAPPELASLLEQIGPQSHHINALPQLRDSPQLDQFMEAYCEVLHRYKEELSKPFNEATFFLGNMESQLSNLCKGTLTNSLGHHRSGGGTLSEEELSCGEMEKEVELSNVSCGTRQSDDQKLRDMLLRKYSGHFSGLRKEFLKRRKKGKLPRDARLALMDWWNTHNRWPYPTEEEKVKLSEVTGLDQKQINNWFINQRKRHWKPTDQDMSFGIMEGEGGQMLI